MREAIAAGVDYRDRVDLTSAECRHRWRAFQRTAQWRPVLAAGEVRDRCVRAREAFSHVSSTFRRDWSKPRHVPALVFSHFDDVPLMKDIVPGLPEGPYPDDWAAVHHVIDEGWMYSLRFDHGTTSAGFLLTPRAVQTPRYVER